MKKENDKWVVRITIASFIALAVGLVYAATAKADGILPAHEASVTEVGPCESGSHWVLTGAAGVTSATLTVDGVDYAMSPNGAGHEWAADAAATTDQTVARVTYTGTLTDTAQLNLSHCEDVSPTPTPTPTDTPSPSTSPSETPSPSTTPPPSSTHTPTPPPSHTHTSPPVSRGPKSSPPPTKTAFTGLGSAGELAALAMVGLLALGGLALLRSKSKA